MARRPSPAQLRLLLALIAAGGPIDVYTHGNIRPATVITCREHEWVVYLPDADRYKIGRHAITEGGELAAAAADPRGYERARATARAAVAADVGTRLLAEVLDTAIPPAAVVTGAIAAAAATSDHITVLVASPPFTSACLGEISPVHATGVALRLMLSDLGHGPTAPAHARMGGAAPATVDTFPPAADCCYRADTGHCEASHDDECRELWRRDLTAERFGTDRQSRG